ncbi:MAG: glycosyl transferase, family 51 [Frankiales bacterium]|nr:glycosyl transferase, family 51 [Frankiales bacterium]
MRTSPGLVRVALALAVSLVAGVVLAGLAFPLVGGLGLVAKRGADDFNVLPSKLSTPSLSQTTTIRDNKNRVIATLFSENRVPVKLAQVPLLARQALIAIEDSRFYEHRGIDVKGTLRAVVRNSSSGSVQQGGSTLTQQYVKNTLIEEARTEAGQKAAIERTAKRKLQEAKYALYLEKSMTKDQILEGYLNIAYYSNGVYGIGTAASHYFRKRVEQLTLAEGALLAGMVQNPRKFDPSIPSHRVAAVARRNVVLARMAQLGYISDADKVKASKEALHLRINKIGSGCEAPGVKAPFFCDYIRRYLEDGPAGAALGETRQERQEKLLGGGLTIHTTLDQDVQNAAQNAVDSKVPADDPFGAIAVADTVEPGTGYVKAMAVDRTFGDKKGQTKVNYALGGSVGFQGGSTFKAFVLARALQMGISPRLTLNAPAKYCPKAFPYIIDGKCGVSNAGDSEAGTFDMVSATWYSVNTYFIQLEERTGLVTPPGLAGALGVEDLSSGSPEPLPRTNPSFVLGTPQVSPLAMAAAYAGFAQHGLYCPPKPITSITDGRGRAVTLKQDGCSQALEPEVADTVTSILRGVVDGPGSARTGASASIGRPVAGKTGTTNSSTAAWFIGYAPQLSTAVWVGKSTPTPMRRVTINGQYYKQVFGGTIPAAIWRSLMAAALAGLPVQGFPDAPLLQSQGQRTAVPDVTGQDVASASDVLRSAGFAVSVAPAINGGPVPAGDVALTSPAAGTPVANGTTIQIIPSNGLAPVVAPSPSSPSGPPPTGAATPSPSAGPPATRAPSPGPTKKRKP